MVKNLFFEKRRKSKNYKIWPKFYFFWFKYTVEADKSLHHKSLRHLKSLRFLVIFDDFPKKITYSL